MTIVIDIEPHPSQLNQTLLYEDYYNWNDKQIEALKKLRTGQIDPQDELLEEEPNAKPKFQIFTSRWKRPILRIKQDDEKEKVSQKSKTQIDKKFETELKDKFEIYFIPDSDEEDDDVVFKVNLNSCDGTSTTNANEKVHQTEEMTEFINRLKFKNS